MKLPGDATPVTMQTAWQRYSIDEPKPVDFVSESAGRSFSNEVQVWPRSVTPSKHRPKRSRYFLNSGFSS
jgi:hypothetical protein